MIFLEDRPQKTVPLGPKLLKHRHEEMNHVGIEKIKKRKNRKK